MKTICPSCPKARCRVTDVKYLPKSNAFFRTHRCARCQRVILTKEAVINPNRKRATLR